MINKLPQFFGLLSLTLLLFIFAAKTAHAAGYTSGATPMQTVTYSVRQLPKTGPSNAWLALALLIPLGVWLKQFGHQSDDSLTN